MGLKECPSAIDTENPFSIQGGAPIKRVLSVAVALNFGSINGGADADLTIAVPGALVGDAVALGLPAAPEAGLVFTAFVSASAVVTVRCGNITGSPINPASATFRALVIGF